ncbi:hypothetical protein [Enterococcus cecorum]|uniref:Uncharacterized protein n=1 Tax=Enterococcus cecorum TaxID=44008 RepID=A0A7X9NLK9_9ENTE|nr:hypothetical protein [Enterococcus cecorum]NME49627.1 hypothetical protein [Enterococcus cecorum]
MHRSYPASTDYTKDVRRVDQLQAAKVVWNVRKIREVKPFPEEMAYTPTWLVDLRRQ